MQALLNKQTQRQLKAYESNPVGTLLLVGGEHSGINFIGNNLSQSLLGPENKTGIFLVEPEKDRKISIEKIREIKKSLTTTINTEEKTGRVVIVKEAHKMTREAQNALLKLIEEPTRKTTIILQAKDTLSLLPTIKSRCQKISILTITSEQAAEYAELNHYDSSKAKTAFLLSRGESELYNDLLTADIETVLPTIVTAKKFISEPVFNRLSTQKEYDKPGLLRELLTSIERISEAGLHAANSTTLNRWRRSLKTINECNRLLDSNTLTKLVFLRLCVQL